MPTNQEKVLTRFVKYLDLVNITEGFDVSREARLHLAAMLMLTETVMDLMNTHSGTTELTLNDFSLGDR